MNKEERIPVVTKDDLTITWFSGHGGGGQHRNKHQNCCRMTHRASGVTCVGTSERSQEANRKEAFLSITKHPNFRLWLANRLREIRDGITLEERVDELMQPKHLKVEVMQNGQWVEYTNANATSEGSE